MWGRGETCVGGAGGGMDVCRRRGVGGGTYVGCGVVVGTCVGCGGRDGWGKGGDVCKRWG